jgi:hypothetical protein
MPGPSANTPNSQQKDSHPCVLDNTKYVNKKNWAITLIRAPGDTGVYENKHVQILYEGCDDSGNYFVKISHLTASSNIPSGNCPSQSGEEVKEIDLTKKVTKNGANAIKYAGKTPTYVQDRVDVEQMLSTIDSTKDSCTFDLLGRHSLFNMPARYLGFMKDNCYTWALDKLYFSGIKLPGYNSGVVFYSDSEDSVTHSVQIQSYDIADLCKLAKKGAIELIQKKFPPSTTDINQLVDFAHPEGPVEVALGHYTPLAIAVAYNQFDTVRLLCEKYNANLNLLNGRFRNHTAMDCASKNWWGANKTPGNFFMFGNFFNGNPDNRIKTYLSDKGAMTYSDLIKSPEVDLIRENTLGRTFRIT